MVEIIEATGQDTGHWRTLRRDGIARYPSDFLLSLAQHDASPIDADIARLEKGGRFLAWQGARPVGLIGLTPYASPSMRHRAEVGLLYVIPDLHGSLTATLLMQAVVSFATAKGIWQL